MSDKETSTLQSYIDSASGTAQSILGSVTGSNADKQAAQEKKEKAALEHDASHAAVKVPGFSASSSGAIAQDDPDRQKGAWNQTVGAGKEFVGSLVGSESLKQDGREQNAAGQGQEAKGQLNDLTTGISNRVSGAVGSTVASVTGDEKARQEAKDKHDIGKTLQRGAEHDINKQAE